MKEMTVKEMYTLKETIAKDLFEGVTYPWEVLPKISSFILELGASLPEEEYEKRGENVWVARSAKVAPTAFIGGPAIIGKDAEVRHCAFIRGNAIVGEGAVVGNSTELKNVLLLSDKPQVFFSLIQSLHPEQSISLSSESAVLSPSTHRQFQNDRTSPGRS